MARLREFQTNLSFSFTDLAEVHDVAFLLFVGHVVSHVDFAATS